MPEDSPSCPAFVSVLTPLLRLAAVMLLFLSFSVPLRADQESPESSSRPPEIRSVRVGLEGFYKNGLWTPVAVLWTPGTMLGGESFFINIDTVDADGTPIRYRNRVLPKLGVASNVVCRNLVYVKLGRSNAAVTFSVEQGDGKNTTLSEKRHFLPAGLPATQNTAADPTETLFCEPVSAERPIYLIIGKEDIGLQGAIAELSQREARRPLLVKVRSFADMPDDAVGLEAVEMIALTTTEPEQFAGMTVSSPQIRALEKWLRSGGRLLFCAGRDSEPLLAAEDAPLRPFLPGRFKEMTELRDGRALTLFCGSQRQIVMTGSEESPYLRLPYFTEPEGIAIVQDKDLPLVLRRAYGLGTLVYFSGDLSGRPLSVWRDRTTLVRRILQWNTERPTAVKSTTGLQLGYNDVSGQVRSALDRFEGVRVVPFSVILLVLVLYWLIVGPLDWLLVRKILKRPALTWVTFPFWIVVFCVLAYVLTIPGRPNRTLVNELTLVDLDVETDFARCSTWCNLYSPGDARYTLAQFERLAVKSEALGPIRFSWNGLPGSGLGGMAPRTVSPTVWSVGSEQSSASGGRIDDVPVQVRSTKSFFGQYTVDGLYSQNDAPLVQSKLSDEEGLPIGTLALRSPMPPLKNAVLVYGRWIQELGDLEPGTEITVDRHTPRREFRDFLLPSRVLESEDLRAVASYNAQSGHLDDIVPVLSFHQALGGYEATGLYHSFLPSLDLSELLTANRALLLGTLDGDNAALGPKILLLDRPESSLDPEHNRLVVYRVSLPIELTALSPRLRIEKISLGGDDQLGDRVWEDETNKKIEQRGGGVNMRQFERETPQPPRSPQ